ncbi:Rad17 cell cycle checkpoint protein-domain-containing protein [Syncephalis pseudoplumigaleata]|uniref:Rad17 cell cycle checkpoint protein-domain-containing protein n=1 Tax=Syncephalis pseudoplumigaleata TaxID=1712513 RepID=A0A4P9YYN1_9FUNG|nr:Rad17 cell cycle checkpoint protein-domain-containing protein [Syncephalis pseudoplumigaleata]|eukprot:RKP24471.1 Rad17 cell cycle checkpoint protein-domain-containing protein [Syncephalis pseudoplumigaleata]
MSTRKIEGTTRADEEASMSRRTPRSTSRARRLRPVTEATFNAMADERGSSEDAAATATDAAVDDRLWTEQYAPMTVSELAMHKRKVASVREWLEQAYSRSMNREAKLLVLTGPCGSGKTATVRVLARELHIDIHEWITPISSTSLRPYASLGQSDISEEYASISQRFAEFMSGGERYTPLIGTSSIDGPSASPKILLLIEDLPYLGREATGSYFERTMLQFLAGLSSVPAILVLSDTLDRQTADEVVESHTMSRRPWSSQHLLPTSITGSPRCQSIR